MYKLFLILIILLNIYKINTTFKNFSLPSFPLPSLPFFGGHTSTVRPIVIINPFPPSQYGHEGHYHGHNRGEYYLVIESSEVPYVNHNFLDGVSFQIHKINNTLAACIGSINLKRHIQQVTLITRLYSCQMNQQCNTYVSEIPRQPFCNFMADSQHTNQYNYDRSYQYHNQPPSCNTIPTQPYGCNLPEGIYQFVVYIPINIVPQQTPGQKWRLDCYMATSGKRIATFTLYAHCSRKETSNQWVSGTSLKPVIITGGYQLSNFQRYAPAIGTTSKLRN